MTTTGPVRRIGRGIFEVGPHRGEHWVAVRAALCMAVPLLVLWGLGRTDLSVYASFGAFAALYGRFDPHIDRLRMQVAAASALVFGMLAGTALSFFDVLAVLRIVAVAVVAGGVSLFAHAWRWHPPGALFTVFGMGACATIPATAGSFLDVLIVGGGAAAFSVLVTLVNALFRGGLRRTDGRRRRFLPPDRGAGATAMTIGIGALLGGLAGFVLVGSHWYWATVAAVAALGGAHVTARLVRGIQRLIGTVIGVLIAAGLLSLNLPVIVTIAIAIVLQGVTELIVGRNYGIAMLFITPLALMMIQLAMPTDPAVLLRDRVVETFIGVVVGTAVAVLSAWLRTRGGRGDMWARP